jgi:hypothetical protein
MKRLLCTGLLLFIAGCGGDDQATRPNDFTPLTSIEIVSPLSSIAPLTSIPLQAIGNFSGLFTRDITDMVLWETTSTLAEFTPLEVPGRVKGLAPGTATLTATLGGISGSFDLTVSSETIVGLAIDPAAPTVHKGLTIQLAANGTFSDNSTQDLTFDAAWISSNDLVATVSDDFTSKGLATGIAEGSADITATFDSATIDTVTLTVTAPQLQSITITPANSSVLSIAQTSFTATGHYSDGTNTDITSIADWTSSPPAIASIIVTNEEAIATTLTEGRTTIGATLDEISASTPLQVTGGNLTTIALKPLNPTMAVGTTQRISATGSFSNNTTRDITGRVTWEVVNSATATVEPASGNLAWLTAVATTSPTPATISATWEAIEGTTNLTVENPTLSSLSITPPSLDLTLNTSDRFTVTGTYTGGHTQDLTSSANWSSPAAAVEVFNLGVNKGRVKGAVAATNPAATTTAAYGGQTATATVGKVVQRTLQSLAISAQPATFIPGTQVSFTATATYSDNTTHVVTEDTVWSVDKTNVAILADTVNQPGLTVAVDSGTATLTAAFGGKTATRTLTVP